MREIQILSVATGPELDIVEGDGHARAVVWPGIGATLRSIHTISLGAGARTVALTHPCDAVYYVIAGSGAAIDPASGAEQELRAGSMVHVDAGTPYVLSAGAERIDLVGGPSPPDPALYG